MKPVTIRFLGRCELSSPNSGGQVPISSKTAVLLARLALPPGQSQDRKRLTEQLWPDRGEVQALASLRQSLWSLRKTVGETDPPLVTADRSSVRMEPRAVEVDTVVFEQLVQSGTRTDLERAAEIYRGDYLAEIDLDDMDSQGPLLFERQRLRELYLAALRSLIGLRASACEGEGAIAIAQRSLALDPFQEDVHAAIIRLHRDAGRLGAAHQQYETCREIFRRELDMPPPAEIEALRKSLGTSPVALPATARPARPSTGHPGDQIKQAPRSQTSWRLPLYLTGAAALASLLLVINAFQVSRHELPMHGTAAEVRPSVVILPFKDTSTGDPPSSFAEGMTDHLITDLSRVSGLFVIAAETSRSIIDRDATPAAAGLKARRRICRQRHCAALGERGRGRCGHGQCRNWHGGLDEPL